MFLVSLFNSKDEMHLKAVSLLDSFKKSKVIISDFILFETITFLNASLKNHAFALKFLKYIESGNNIQIIDVDSNIKRSALDIFKRFSDKSFFFTDCTSFVIIDNYYILSVYIFDDHFNPHYARKFY